MAQCTAHNRSGGQCMKAAIRGANVCYTHGGATPQVKRSAADRLQAARDMMLEKFLDPALATLIELIRSPDVPAAVRARATDSLLDRVGLGATQKTEATVHTDGPSDVDAAISELVARLEKAPEAAPSEVIMDS